MSDRLRLAVPDTLYVQPLLFGLSKPDSLFEVSVDLSSKNSLKLAERTENTRCAFISPIDYARHGGEYTIVPGVCVASSERTDTIRLFMKRETRTIKTIASDIRLTTELVLTKILLKEKFLGLASASGETFIPMQADVRRMLEKADAALVLESYPGEHQFPDLFSLDLGEEWSDLMELPYVHGFWVAREEDVQPHHVQGLIDAAVQGTALASKMAEAFGDLHSVSRERCSEQISRFQFVFGADEQESVSEFLRLAYYHGIIGDVPDLNYFDDPTSIDPTLLN